VKFRFFTCHYWLTNNMLYRPIIRIV